MKFASIRRCYLGNLGSGKTLSMVRSGIKYIKRTNGKIYANFSYEGLGSRHFEPITSAGMIFDLAEKRQPCKIDFDEFGSLADSRRGLSVLNDVFTTFCMLSRKYQWQIEYSEQYVTMIDLRIRAITDDVVEPDTWGQHIIERHYIPHPYEYYFGRKFKASPFFDFYDHEQPPLTLDIQELKRRWDKYKKDHNIGA